MRRRAFVVSFLTLALLGACKNEERCGQCGMKIDRASPWRAELVATDGAIRQFDSPRCALRAWIASQSTATMAKVKSVRVQEYYDRAFHDATELRFVVGGDVTGPMGPDLVPVEPSRVTKFIQDHGADRAYTLGEITPAVLSKKSD